MIRSNSIGFCAFGLCIRGFSMGADHILAWTLQHLMVDGMDTFLQLQASMDITGCFQWILVFWVNFFLENWTWFMTQLCKALGEMPILAVCSNACKGLIKVVTFVSPNAKKRECFRHLMQNYIKKFAGWKHMCLAVKAYWKEVFEHHFAYVRGIYDLMAWM